MVLIEVQGRHSHEGACEKINNMALYEKMISTFKCLKGRPIVAQAEDHAHKRMIAGLGRVNT